MELSYFYVKIVLVESKGGSVVGIKLTEVKAGSRITFYLSKDGRKLKLDGTLKKHVKEDMAFIDLHYNSTKKLSFKDIEIAMEYHFGGMAITWKEVKLGTYKGEYLMQVLSEGIKVNKRNSFRIDVNKPASCQRRGRGIERVIIKDISMTGFAIADRDKILGIKVGEVLRILFEDMGYQIDLVGKVVREEKREDMIIYGVVTSEQCKDLPAYMNLKQRQKHS